MPVAIDGHVRRLSAEEELRAIAAHTCVASCVGGRRTEGWRVAGESSSKMEPEVSTASAGRLPRVC